VSKRVPNRCTCTDSDSHHPIVFRETSHKLSVLLMISDNRVDARLYIVRLHSSEGFQKPRLTLWHLQATPGFKMPAGPLTGPPEDALECGQPHVVHGFFNTAF
jgi:hypothetical protein